MGNGVSMAIKVQFQRVLCIGTISALMAMVVTKSKAC